MRRLILWTLLWCLASNVAWAQGAGWREQARNTVAQVQNFFAPDTGHSHWRNALAAVGLAGVVCASWMGCFAPDAQKTAEHQAEIAPAAVDNAADTQEEALPWWGTEVSVYQGTGVWTDSQGSEGKLKISYVLEYRGEETNFWLTLDYGDDHEIDRFFASKLDFMDKLWSLDGMPVGTADVEEDGLSYRINYHFVHGEYLFTLNKMVSEDEEIRLQGEKKEKEGRVVQWGTVKLTPIKVY